MLRRLLRPRPRARLECPPGSVSFPERGLVDVMTSLRASPRRAMPYDHNGQLLDPFAPHYTVYQSLFFLYVAALIPSSPSSCFRLIRRATFSIKYEFRQDGQVLMSAAMPVSYFWSADAFKKYTTGSHALFRLHFRWHKGVLVFSDVNWKIRFCKRAIGAFM